MAWIWTSLYSLVVDDGALALALMGWTVTLGFLAAVVLAMLPVADPMLLLGCAKILVCNVVLAARLR